MTLDDAAKLVALAAAAFPGMMDKPGLSATARVWHKLLEDLPDKAAEAGLVAVLTTARYFPSPGEIRAATLALTAPKRLNAAEAWEEVVREMKRVSVYKTPVYSSQLIKRTVAAMGGWRSLCESENPSIDRAQFQKMYDALAERENKADALPPVVSELLGRIGKELPDGKHDRVLGDVDRKRQP